MKVIYKQQLLNTEKQTIPVPEGARIISALDQHGVICVWFICDTENKLEDITIHIFMTGHQLPVTVATLNFISTIIDTNGFVLHIFEGELPCAE